MTLTHLLSAALLICATLAFSQDKQAPRTQGDSVDSRSATAPSEPWRIIPDQPTYGLGQDARGGMRIDQFKVDRGFRVFNQEPETMIIGDGDLPSDRTCYTIRSFRVERDSKDSDSTHPAGSSTCLPASRYGMKNVEVRPATVDR